MIENAWQIGAHMLVGVIATTWIPAGFASASVVFALTVRRYPCKYLESPREDDMMFFLMAILGWYFFVIVVIAMITNPQYHGAGMLCPGKRARKEAEYLRLKMTLCSETKPRRSFRCTMTNSAAR